MPRIIDITSNATHTLPDATPAIPVAVRDLENYQSGGAYAENVDTDEAVDLATLSVGEYCLVEGDEVSPGASVTWWISRVLAETEAVQA